MNATKHYCEDMEEALDIYAIHLRKCNYTFNMECRHVFQVRHKGKVYLCYGSELVEIKHAKRPEILPLLDWTGKNIKEVFDANRW